jgi:hypothetical protein
VRINAILTDMKRETYFRTLKVHLTKQEYAELKKQSLLSGASMSEIIRQAVDAHFEIGKIYHNKEKHQRGVRKGSGVEN